MIPKLSMLLILIVTLFMIGDIDISDSVVYTSLIDGYSGFGEMSNTVGKPIIYENSTFNINVGDSIIWINNDVSDRITVISEQGLWSRDGILLADTGKRFSYVFNNTGRYTFFIKEYKRFPKQIIVVSEIVNGANMTDGNVDTIVDDGNVDIGIGNNITNNDENVDTVVGNTTVDNATIVDNTTVDDATNDTIVDDGNVDDATNDTIVDDGNVDIGIGNNITNNDEDIYINVNNSTADNIIVSKNGNVSTNPILLPLNILGNLKMTGIMTFVIIVIISLVKD